MVVTGHCVISWDNSALDSRPCDGNVFCSHIDALNKAGTLMGKDVFDDDLKLHFLNQSEITTEDNTIRGCH